MRLAFSNAWIAAAWRDRQDAGRRLLHVYVAVTFALLTYHDYKIDRSLTIAWPLTWLLALGAVADLAPALLERALAVWRRLYPSDPSERRDGDGLRAALPWAPLASVAIAGLLFLPWLHASRIRTFAEKDDFRPEPVVREVLQRLEQEGRSTEQLWVTGWFFRLSPNLIEWWLRSHDVPAKLKLDQVPLREKTRTGIDRAWDEKYAAWVLTTIPKDPHRDAEGNIEACRYFNTSEEREEAIKTYIAAARDRAAKK
jgi:hypothetical protein